jgi:hypothetical protein
LNLPILLVSIAVLIWTIVLWPLSWLLRRGYHTETGVDPEIRRLKFYLRCASVVGVIYLASWIALLLPALSLQLQFYSYRLDPLVLAMECAGILPIAAAAVGIWAAWWIFMHRAPWTSLIGTIFVSAALLGIVWISFMGGLQGLNLNY